MDVSILICTHNSAQNIAQTLSCLGRQKVPATLSWEILIVDYISSDGTIELAAGLWKDDRVPLRVFRETQAGKSPALETGFANAQGAVVCVVDDDNWVDENYVRVAHETMAAHPDVGVIGAFGEAACAVSPPAWFDEFKTSYAVGAQGNARGYAQPNRLWFWGAGSAIRRQAWLTLNARGFKAILNPSRSDGVLFKVGFTGGEDPELCYAIQLVGYKLWYEPDLIYKHGIPARRLTLDFLKNACYGVSAATPIVTLYYVDVMDHRYKRRLPKYIYGNWYLYIVTSFSQFCRGVLLSLRGRKGMWRIHCLMQWQTFKGKMTGAVRIGPSGFRDISRRVARLRRFAVE